MATRVAIYKGMPGRGDRGNVTTLESAKEQLARRLYVTPDTAEKERLEALLPRVLREIDGEYSIKGSVNLEPHVVSWQPAS